MPFYPHASFHVMMKRPDVVIMEGATNLANNIFLFPACKLIGSKVIWWDAGRRAGSQPNILRRISDPLINAMMRRADACIAYSTLAKEYMVEQGVHPDRIIVAFNTVDTEALDQKRSQNEIKAEDIKQSLNLRGHHVIIYAGVIEKRKRVELLIDAFVRLRTADDGVRLLIVGSGPHEGELRKYAGGRGMDGITFLGRKVEDLGAYMLASDVFVLPSEGGLGIVEAMAHGLPVIVSSADGTERDLVQRGENGFIVPEENVDALVEAIQTILNHPETRRRFGAAARAQIDGPFSVASFIRSMKSAIEHTEKKVQA